MVKFTAIEDAFFFVSSTGFGMHSAVLNKESGQIYYRSEMGELDEMSDEDLDGDACIEIPHKNDLSLGRELVFEFVTDHLPDEYEHARHIFGTPGAYGRFKALLESKGLLQMWFDFEHRREEQALREWCKENEIQLSD